MYRYIVLVAQIDSKTILWMFQELDQIAEYHLHHQKMVFQVLCALFEQIPFGMNRDILRNPTLCGAKNSNKPYYT